MQLDINPWIIFLLIVPMYFANSSAVFFHGSSPLDFNLKWKDGNRLLGGGKTVRGTIFGILMGWVAGIIFWILAPEQTKLVSGNYIVYAFLLSFGAITGDVIKSFFKRRAGVESGKPLLVVDQLDFIAGGILLGMIEFTPTLEEFIIICIMTLILHRWFNYIAFKANLKKVPW